MKMIVLVIKFKEFFLPNQDAFLETERGFSLEQANIQKPISFVTQVLYFGRI